MDIALIIKTIIMGIVEGLTEFLPVSSTGHLIITGALLQFPKDIANSFEIVIQLGAILALVVYFARDLISLIGRAASDQTARRLLIGVLIAVVPAAVLGLALNKLINTYLFNPLTVAFALIVGGILMLIVESTARQVTTTKLESVSLGQALAIGAAQSLSLWPGFSRSASTLMGGLLAGLDRPTALRFSFYLSIPTMLAATVYAFIKDSGGIQKSELLLYGIGMVVAFIVALFVVRFFLGYVARHDLKPFAWYRIVLGVVLIGLVAFGLLSMTA